MTDTPSAPAPDTTRMQVHGTRAEAAELDAAAKTAGFTHHNGGRSEFMLRASLSAARAGGGVLSVSGKPAAAVIADATAEGITLEAWLERALMITRTARGPGPGRPPSPAPALRRRPAAE